MIRFKCQCGQELRAYPLDRGKIMQCTKCGLSSRVPTNVPDDEEGQYGLEKIEEQRPKLDAETAALPVEEAVAPKGGTCPKCGAETRLGQTICVQCGVDFWTGKTARIIPVRRYADYASKSVEWDAQEFSNQFASSFVYPLKDIGLLVAVCLAVMLLGGIASVGLAFISAAFALGVAVLTGVYFAAYAFGIAQTSLLGDDDVPNMPGPSMDALVTPLAWLVCLVAIFCGPAIALAVAALFYPKVALLAVVAGSFGFALLPMSVLVVAGAGELSLKALKGVFRSVGANAHLYVIYLAVLLTAAGLSCALSAFLTGPLTADDWIWRMFAGVSCGILSYMVSIYMLVSMARALGILGRYRAKTLDFGEGAAEPGLNRALGAMIILGFVAALSAAGYIAVRHFTA